MASEQIWMPLSSAARLNAACVFGSRSVGVFPSVGYCTLTWMPSSPISRASAIFVMSPRWPRFQSVIPTRTGTGLTGLLRLRRRAIGRARRAGIARRRRDRERADRGDRRRR